MPVAPVCMAMGIEGVPPICRSSFLSLPPFFFFPRASQELNLRNYQRLIKMVRYILYHGLLVL